jgi:ABC-2 type transport system permease protein
MSVIPKVLPSTVSLSHSTWASELRALGAIARKEWLYFKRYPSWILALFIWPVLFPMLYILTAQALAGPDGSGLARFTQVTGVADFLGYIAIGTTVWMWQNMVLWNVGFLLRSEQMRGTLESNWLSPTWRFSFLFGGSLVQMFVMLVFLAVTALEFGVFFGVRFNGSLGLALLVIAASMPSIYGIGIAFASLVITAKEAQNFVFLVRSLVMIFSGITFPVALLPRGLQAISYWLPQTYTIRAFRSAALAGATLGDISADLLALVVFGAVWLALGFILFNIMERRARKTGGIGTY